MSLMVLASLLGPDDLPLLGYRVLINDRSNAQKRTRNLNVRSRFQKAQQTPVKLNPNLPTFPSFSG